ncbi:hypothetical protein AVDCRST_MAG81-225 [uncultured Synechococcales cyanobacterium]|uniref:Uncharacterized protein n=1 Tax=uncultured Synechococcales cyanobacterium TaxID=1936017 RepID=A0A6J4UTP0_9CYAN|nr:hypothetical protein AVDCRST_MAG81-225 [uncultured Synechococcales cyanobacterium]
MAFIGTDDWLQAKLRRELLILNLSEQLLSQQEG